jgi:hypothetical protein
VFETGARDGSKRVFTTVISDIRRYAVLLLLAIPTCAASAGCSNAMSVSAKQVFSDPAAAQVAEAAASGDTTRVDC